LVIVQLRGVWRLHLLNLPALRWLVLVQQGQPSGLLCGHGSTRSLRQPQTAAAWAVAGAVAGEQMQAWPCGAEEAASGRCVQTPFRGRL
jgi:hypothetical protein